MGVFQPRTFRGRPGIDRPADDSAAERVEYDSAVHLALPCGVFGDVGDPQPIRFGLSELAVDEIRSGRDIRYIPVSGTPRESLNACPVHQQSDRLAANADTEAEGQLRMYPFGPIGLA